MTDGAYGKPLLVAKDGGAQPLERLPLTGEGASGYNERFLQDLIFDNAACLPVSEIDASFHPLIPVCMELATPVGPLDILYVTPTGKLAIVEAKLWRNPEARRKVIGQILDYAKELSEWSYEDLQREVSRALGRKGNVLFELVRATYPSTDEHTFCDAVARSLRRGQFLLLIVGDGIREGAGAIAEFIDRSGNLEFTFGLVELALYGHPSAQCLVQPRVLAKTMVVKRTVIRIEQGLTHVAEDEPEVEEERGSDGMTDSQRWYFEFWSKLNLKLRLDDASQPVGKATRSQNYFLSMPPSGSQAWVSAYFMSSRSVIGVYLRFQRGNFADTAFTALKAQREEIEAEVGQALDWRAEDGRYTVSVQLPIDNPLDPLNHERVLSFFLEWLNKYVNAFRPRLGQLAEDL